LIKTFTEEDKAFEEFTKHLGPDLIKMFGREEYIGDTLFPNI